MCGVPDGAVLGNGGGGELSSMHECAARDILSEEEGHASDEPGVPLVRPTRWPCAQFPGTENARFFCRECNAGSVRVGSTCVSCESGTTFRDATRNVEEEGQTNTCFACGECTQQQAVSGSNGVAEFSVSGTYMTQECLPASDRVCALCSTSCGPGRRITAWCMTRQDLQCTACTTTCDPGEYLSSETCDGDTTTDAVREGCLECVESCSRGFFLKGTCPGNTRESNQCFACDLNRPCDNKYRAGCSGTQDTFCQDFPVCDNGFYLSDESATQPGTCRPCSDCGSQSVVRPCTRFDDTVCRGTSSCSEGLPCSLLSASNRSSFFCDYSLGPTRAFCGVCPPGYRSDGQYCVECPRGYTCDLAGRLACRGQCPPWVRSECVQDFGLGFARCPAASLCSQASNFGETRVAWRGSFELASEDNCATYFLCRPGHYKNFSAGGTVSCDGCDEALLPVGARWTTEGLSPEDDESCLWGCRAETHAPSEDGLGCVAKDGRGLVSVGNLAGYWRGVSSGGVCGLGRTSQAGAAMSPEECLACEPLVPDVMRWRDKTDQCEFECLDPTDTRRGSRCVPERLGCDEEAGLARGPDGVCAAQAYPWNRAGRRKTGGVVVVASTRTIQPAEAEAPYPRASSVGSGIKDRHSVTPRAGAAALPVQGPLCSATTGVVGGHEYVFGAVCNQSFLVYLDLSQAGAGLRVLIGDGERGWRDGFKTQARFESELYVAGEGQGRLFVLDTWNCVLREVVVWDRPGSYLTRVYTLWGDTGKLGLAEGAEAKCYGPGSLAWPRRFWPLLGAGIAGWLAFADEDGLWQFHTGTRELLEVAKEAAVEFEADELEHVTLTDPFTLRLLFRGGYEMLLEAAQEPCPDGRTSLAGGECTLECRWLDLSGRPARYVDAATGQCRACTRPACGVGEELVLCTPRADGVCRRCALWADPACAACPLAAGLSSGEACIRCSVQEVSVSESAEVFEGPGGDTAVFRFLSSGTIGLGPGMRATILLIGGGGAGGTWAGGGGGAGAVIFADDVLLGGGSLAVAVGAPGQPSSIGTAFVAAAGGPGGSGSNSAGTASGSWGGSGGGAAACSECSGSAGGVAGASTFAGVPGVSASANVFANGGAQGSSHKWFTGREFGGGGGGAGSSPTGGECGSGGAGLSGASVAGRTLAFSDVFGQAYTSVASQGFVAGGGAGGACCNPVQACGAGGAGGGGSSLRGWTSGAPGGSGAANTGSGGGGGAMDSSGGQGGSGLVLIRVQSRLLSPRAGANVPLCACTASAALVYSVDGTCDEAVLRPIPPCEAGWYLLAGAGYCAPCPPFTATLFPGATRAEQCKCVEGMARRGGECVGEDLYEFEPSCLGSEACSVPRDALIRTDGGPTCGWVCRPGHYRDTRAGFLDQCRPCLLPGADRTRGDDDEPWSCE